MVPNSLGEKVNGFIVPGQLMHTFLGAGGRVVAVGVITVMDYYVH